MSILSIYINLSNERDGLTTDEPNRFDPTPEQTAAANAVIGFLNSAAGLLARPEIAAYLRTQPDAYEWLHDAAEELHWARRMAAHDAGQDPEKIEDFQLKPIKYILAEKPA